MFVGLFVVLKNDPTDTGSLADVSFFKRLELKFRRGKKAAKLDLVISLLLHK